MFVIRYTQAHQIFLLNRFSDLRYDLRTLRRDVLGGVAAAVVGLPVALAFGLAAGLGLAAGIYGAISVVTLAAGLFWPIDSAWGFRVCPPATSSPWTS